MYCFIFGKHLQSVVWLEAMRQTNQASILVWSHGQDTSFTSPLFPKTKLRRPVNHLHLPRITTPSNHSPVHPSRHIFPLSSHRAHRQPDWTAPILSDYAAHHMLRSVHPLLRSSRPPFTNWVSTPAGRLTSSGGRSSTSPSRSSSASCTLFVVVALITSMLLLPRQHLSRQRCTCSSMHHCSGCSVISSACL